MRKGMGVARRWAVALWMIALMAACSGGGAATTDGGLEPTLDAAPVDAPAGEDASVDDADLPADANVSEPDSGMADSGTPDSSVADAGTPDRPTVRMPLTGEVTGMWDGASVTVRLQGTGLDDQHVTLDANGRFAFPVDLPEGTPFVATVDSSPALHSCSVHNQRGRVWQGTLPVQIVCTGPALQIELSNPDGFRFDPMTRAYDLAYSFLSDEQLLRVVGDSQLTVRLDGATLPIGAWSSIPMGVAPATARVEVGAGDMSLAFDLTFRSGVQPFTQSGSAKSATLRQFEQFGARVAVSRDTLIASGGFDTSSATVFRRTDAGWVREQLLQSPDLRNDSFGASMAIAGDTLVVGAPLSDRFGSNSGAAFVYRRGFFGWVLVAALRANNAEAGDSFGGTVAIDGDTIVVGAPEESSAATGVNGVSPGPEDNARPASGAVYVFRRSGMAWIQEAYVKASNTDANDRFGDTVAISGDTIAVGTGFEDSAATGVNGAAPGQGDNSMTSAGAVYVFRRSSTSWAQEAYIKASNTGALDFFGDSIALSGDTLVVGAPKEDSAATGVDGSAPGPDDNSKNGSGAAYVFHRVNGAWAQQAYLKASNTGAGDAFGASVAVRHDTVVVGARFEDGGGRGVNPVSPGPDDDSKDSSGAVYVFRHGDSWFQDAYVKSSNSDAIDAFGTGVAIAPDTIAVGAPGESSCFSIPDSNNDCVGAGATYLFR